MAQKPRKGAIPASVAVKYTGAPVPLLRRYFQDGLSVRDQSVVAFRDNPGGIPRLNALSNLLCYVWPGDFVDTTDCSRPEHPVIRMTRKWNPWLRRALEGFTNETYAVRQGDSVFRIITLTGVAAAGKTFSTGLYAMAWWAVSPLNSIVVMTSTSKKMIRGRTWNVVRHFAKSARDLETGQPIHMGRLVDSEMQLRVDDTTSTSMAGIYVFAVGHGETLKAVDNLKGLHAERMLVVIDEANSTEEAIFQTVANYRKGCKDLTIIVIGNPVSRLDLHGKCCTPSDGWDSIDPSKAVEWKSAAIPEWQFDSGLVLRFAGWDNPNVKLGRNAYPHIYSFDDWKAAQGARSTFHWYVYDEGFWPPSGFVNAVLSETMVMRYKAAEKGFRFLTVRHSVASLDPAFGGDACVALFGSVGDIEEGRHGLTIEEHITINPDLSSDIPADHQVARRFIDLCKERAIQPRHAGILATGTGRGVYAIAAAEWHSDVMRIEEGGAPSDLPASESDLRPSKEVYDRRVTELWFSVREFVQAGQIRGLYPDAITQFCNRTWEERGRKIVLEKKEDYKQRIGRSPDDGDAVAALIEVVRRTTTPTTGRIATRRARAWSRLLSDTQAVYDSPYEENPEADGVPSYEVVDV